LDRTGGHPRSPDCLNHHIEESHDDVVHHVPGLDHSDGDSHSWGVSSRKSAARSRFSCCTIAYTRARDIGTSLL
uniref:hypothetical protein n=4 Tax=Mycobacteroides abscessus TaxID=36809 RepID=UPI001A96F2DE